MKLICVIFVVLLPFCNAYAIQGNIMFMQSSVSTSCNVLCGYTAYAGGGACRSGIMVDSTYLNTLKLLGAAAPTYGTVTSVCSYANPYVVPTNVGGTCLLTGMSSCTSTQQYQYCTCDYSPNTTITPVPISTSMNNFTSSAMSSYGAAINPYLQFTNANTPRATTAFDATPPNEFSSIAMDANDNIYYTIAGSRLQGTAAGDAIYTTQSAPFLYVLYYPYTGQPQYTSISTCAYVFDNRVNVFCVGSAGLIKVV